VEWSGETLVSLKWKGYSRFTTKRKFQVFKISCGINSHHGQIMVVAWRRFGNVLRKLSSRISIVFSHVKF
jgi:hypothetical protein